MDIVERLRKVENLEEEIGAFCRETMLDAADEIELLRKSLTTIRGAQYRLADPRYPQMVFVNRGCWSEAFKDLIAPPYNQLKWEEIPASAYTRVD